MVFNLIVLILTNILLQNNYKLLGHYDSSSYDTNPPTICIHDDTNDYWQLFQKKIDKNLIIIIQSLQIFIFIPSLLGVIIVMNYSGKLISKYFNNMKLLLSTPDENPP